MMRVLVFTDEPVVAFGLAEIFSSSDEFELVSTCKTIEQLTQCLSVAKPDLLLMDLTHYVTLDTLAQLQDASPALKIVLWVDSVSVGVAYQALENGVRGILRKTLPPETILKCLRMVSQGGLWFEQSFQAGPLAARTVSLTRRESQLVSLLAKGLRNKEIAALLSISEGTVKVYLSALFRKLGAKDRFEVALFGLRNKFDGEPVLEMSQVNCGFFRPLRKDMEQHSLRSLLVTKAN
jgi:two-component system nitrate/nitrite response regulator NarL